MINSITNLYHSKDLCGDELTKPLKSYHNFFANKIENCSGLKSLAWSIANLVSGIVLYPILGALAAMGLLVKLMGTCELKRFNESEKKTVDNVRSGVKYSAGYGNASNADHILNGEFINVVKEFKVRKASVDQDCDAIKRDIDFFTQSYRQICIRSFGVVDQGAGEIIVQIKAR